MPAVVSAIKAEESRRRALAARLEALDAPPRAITGELEDRLRGAVEGWRAILGRHVPVGRQILAKLLAEKVEFVREDRNGRRASGSGLPGRSSGWSPERCRAFFQRACAQLA